jgi:hypothetical protein
MRLRIKKNPLSGSLTAGFEFFFQGLRHYQASACQIHTNKEKQQGGKYPCCADNDDNTEGCEIHHPLVTPLEAID